MAISNLPSSFRDAIPKWCHVKIKKIKNPLKPWKKKTIRKQKFDAGKLQTVLFVLINKVNEVISNMNDFKTESQIRSIITGYGYATQSQLTSHANTQAGQTHTSDRRLKYDVNTIGKSPSGLNIYTFRFKNSDRYGNHLYQGVMSDEVPKSVVDKDDDGYDMVDYNKIDVNFVKVNNL